MSICASSRRNGILFNENDSFTKIAPNRSAHTCQLDSLLTGTPDILPADAVANLADKVDTLSPEHLNAATWNMNGMAAKPGHWGFPDQMLQIAAQQVKNAEGIPLSNRLPDGMDMDNWSKELAEEMGNAPFSVKSFGGGCAKGVRHNPRMPELGQPDSNRSDYDALTYAMQNMDNQGSPYWQALNNDQADALGPFIDAAMTGQLDYSRFGLTNQICPKIN